MPRRRYRLRFPLVGAILAVALAVAGYIVGLAHWQAASEPLYEPADLYVARMIDVVIALWCIWVASSIGSFLNVVAWRMPRGESINGRSHCPRCHVQLRARDNFPIFGWLALGGRCRVCRLPISPRYPIVEATVGFSVAAVAICELYQLNLPWQTVHAHRGPLWAPVITPALLLTLLYHTVALSVSWAMGLIRMDGHRLPTRLLSFAAIAVSLPMLVFPTLMIVPWQVEVSADWSPDGLFVDAGVRVVTAIAAAVVFARFLSSSLCPNADPKLDPLGKGTSRLIDLIAILSVPCVVVGWQAAPAIVVIASLLAAGLRRRLPPATDALGSFAIATPLALTVQLIGWRFFHPGLDSEDGSFSLWPSDQGEPWIFLLWCGLVLLTPLWLSDHREPTIPRSLPSTDITSSENTSTDVTPRDGVEADRTEPSSDPAGRNQNHSSEENVPRN